MVRQRFTLALDEAQAITAEAVAGAERRGVAVSVAILDEAGLLVTFARMDTAVMASLDAAMDKAYTSATFQSSTIGLFAAVRHSPDVIATMAQRPRVVLFGGGVPILSGSSFLGALGVSGAPDAMVDHQIAIESVAGAGLSH